MFASGVTRFIIDSLPLPFWVISHASAFSPSLARPSGYTHAPFRSLAVCIHPPFFPSLFLSSTLLSFLWFVLVYSFCLFFPSSVLIRPFYFFSCFPSRAVFIYPLLYPTLLLLHQYSLIFPSFSRHPIPPILLIIVLLFPLIPLLPLPFRYHMHILPILPPTS